MTALFGSRKRRRGAGDVSFEVFSDTISTIVLADYVVVALKEFFTKASGRKELLFAITGFNEERGLAAGRIRFIREKVPSLGRIDLIKKDLDTLKKVGKTGGVIKLYEASGRALENFEKLEEKRGELLKKLDELFRVFLKPCKLEDFFDMVLKETLEIKSIMGELGRVVRANFGVLAVLYKLVGRIIKKKPALIGLRSLVPFSGWDKKNHRIFFRIYDGFWKHYFEFGRALKESKKAFRNFGELELVRVRVGRPRKYSGIRLKEELEKLKEPAPRVLVPGARPGFEVRVAITGAGMKDGLPVRPLVLGDELQLRIYNKNSHATSFLVTEIHPGCLLLKDAGIFSSDHSVKKGLVVLDSVLPVKRDYPTITKDRLRRVRKKAVRLDGLNKGQYLVLKYDVGWKEGVGLRRGFVELVVVDVGTGEQKMVKVEFKPLVMPAIKIEGASATKGGVGLKKNALVLPSSNRLGYATQASEYTITVSGFPGELHTTFWVPREFGLPGMRKVITKIFFRREYDLKEKKLDYVGHIGCMYDGSVSARGKVSLVFALRALTKKEYSHIAGKSIGITFGRRAHGIKMDLKITKS